MSTLRQVLSKIDDYPAYLEACWQEHLAPRADNAPTVISTFSGCGGSSLGYSMAGFRELLAIEWDDNAVETFKLNFPDIPIYHGDIVDCSIDWILEKTGLIAGNLDLLDGSPPCQGFSISGKRSITDGRNQLFREFVRVLRELQPKVFVMENVSGMVKGKMKLIFSEIMQELKISGYKVSTRLLNAMYFGVPQSRERIIFIGVREDLGIEPSHPAALNIPINVSQAWEGKLDNSDSRLLSSLAKSLWELTPQGESLEVGARQLLNKKEFFTSRKLSLQKPSNTIQKSHGSIVCHPLEPRGLSLHELKRLASFPDNFLFTDRNNGLSRIGNSVPPLFMRSIANHIRQEILNV